MGRGRLDHPPNRRSPGANGRGLKGADPTTRIHIRDGNGRNASDGETAREVSGRGGRIQKRLLPQVDVGFRSVEFDASEEVDSCPMNPGFGDDATRFERRRFVA